MTTLSATSPEGITEELPVHDVTDDTESYDIAETVQYNITSYGADFDVEGLVRRINRGSIFVPEFQRAFVWSLPQASQFIESLLLGLPVPGIFLAQESETEKLMVIDGQQRLKTLQFFYSGSFREGEAGIVQLRPFLLDKVNRDLEGMKYADLSERDQNRLDNSLLHATIVRQNSPDDGMSSIFHIFHRLNTGGTRLAPQEIRRALYQGPLLESVTELNDDEDWRAIYGGASPRQKDQELILRFWAMYMGRHDYAAPMLGFLNSFTEKHRNPSIEFLYEGRTSFKNVCQTFNAAMGSRAFRTEGSRQLNAAVFDSMAVGLANRTKIRNDKNPDLNDVARVHESLLRDPAYRDSVAGGTAQAASVATRMQKATDAFEAI